MLLVAVLAALVALYNAAGGPNWTQSENWLSEEPLRSWAGVTTNGPGRVTGLDLGSSGLSGTLPAALGNLRALEELRLQGNDALTGELPHSLPELLRLETLSLGSTDLCAPRTAYFQAWLGQLRSYDVENCVPEEESVIDVAVFYTPSARDALRGTEATKAQIDLLIREANQAYADSGVHQSLSLVAAREVQYDEVRLSSFTPSAKLLQSILATHVRRFMDPDDGYIDEVHAVRDEVGADICVLLVGKTPTGSTAVTTLAEASEAFAVVGALSGSGSFVHALGHLQGVAHDRYQDCKINGSCPDEAGTYGFGYVNQRAFAAGAPASSRWRTVMAFNRQCGDNGIDCPRLLRFSNPDLVYPDSGGDPMGATGTHRATGMTGPANAARRLNTRREAVANFRLGPKSSTVSISASVSPVTEGTPASFTVALDKAPSTALTGYLVGTASSASVTVQDDDAATTTSTAPPAQLGAPDVQENGLDALLVSWSGPDPADPRITGYDLQYRKSDAAAWSNGPLDHAGTSAEIVGLDSDTNYQVRVRAQNAAFEGAWSDPGEGTTALWVAALTVGGGPAPRKYWGYYGRAGDEFGRLAPKSFTYGGVEYGTVILAWYRGPFRTHDNGRGTHLTAVDLVTSGSRMPDDWVLRFHQSRFHGSDGLRATLRETEEKLFWIEPDISLSLGETYEVAFSRLPSAEKDENFDATAPLTAEFVGLPETHDGTTPLTFQLRFSEETELSYTAFQNGLLELTGGDVSTHREAADGRRFLEATI